MQMRMPKLSPLDVEIMYQMDKFGWRNKQIAAFFSIDQSNCSKYLMGHRKAAALIAQKKRNQKIIKSLMRGGLGPTEVSKLMELPRSTVWQWSREDA
jgi:predicted transcriptional regulator